ncbi:hypothetical protein [Bacillus swezeyi]|uniref:hypothetical protein n=1 Tax=Bacillus swezeyi TaxID=1925020 RepID=UPI0011E8E597|nr:hypothetical protein [Bacillus swezeyi]TYS34894.1 hypothetical protein FZC77_15640 [Bacillus swezeyi]
MLEVNYYHLCKRSKGRAVEIRDRHGKVYRGRISYTTPRGVYLHSLHGPGGFFIPFIVIVSLIFLSALFFF